MHKPQTYRYVWHQTLNLATSTSSLLTFKSMICFNKCDWSIPSTSEPDTPGCQCWGEMPNSQQGGQCSALPHTGHFSVWSSCTSHIPQSWSGCTSHLWETPRCWIPNMAREHSSFKTESPSLWHRSVDSVFQTLCSSWELVFVCMDGALFHTHRNDSFSCWAPWAELYLPRGEQGHTEMSVCTYLFFGSLIFAM